MIRLTIATMLPALVSVLFCLADKRTAFSRLSYQAKQVIIGVAFGGIAVLATEFGIPVDGAVLNVRTAAPLTAGLLFGVPAGIIAGVIGGVERWFSVYWSGGAYTQLACTISTIMAGLISASARKRLFDGKRASWGAGFAIGLATEVLHMLLVFLTNMSDIHTAFSVVQKCAPLMIVLNATAVALSLFAAALLENDAKNPKQNLRPIARIYRSGLMICVLIAFMLTCAFTTVLQVQITKESTATALQTGLDEVPQNLNDITDNTFLIYAEWIADDVGEEGYPTGRFLAGLAASYVVPEILIVDSQGKILSANIASAVGSVVPPKYRPSPNWAERVWNYGQSFINSEAPMQYAVVMLDGGEFVYVGYDENFVADEIAKRMETIAASKHLGRDGFLIISGGDGVIISDRNGHAGKSLSKIGIDLSGIPENTTVRAAVDGVASRLMHRRMETIAGTFTLIAVLPESEAVFERNTSVYITAFMEIIVFAVLFVNVYFLTNRVVVNNIHKVNDSLSRITGGNLDEQIDVRDNAEFASLTDDINATVKTLKHYIAEAAARIDRELEFARAIQRSALPSVFPPYPNRKDFEIYALMDPAKEVGGDFYDFFLLDNDRLGFVIADVSGKGIPAAMFMMTAKTVIKGLAESGMDTDGIFTKANATLCQGNDTGMFVTAWIGILNLHTGLLSFTNAGHNPPLVRREGGAFEFLRTRPNFILAGMRATRYQKEELQLSPGDEIFLYTDGVTEARNPENQMFLEDRLIQALNRSDSEGAEARCKTLREELAQFIGTAEQFDDITMLSVRVNYLQSSDRLMICPNMASTDAVWEFLDCKIKRAELSRKLAAKVKICTDEIYSNILWYSNATQAEIDCRIDENLLTLVFRDNGVPYDPTVTGDPDVESAAKERKIGGLGIYMVKNSVKSLHYAYAGHQNVLTLTFDF